MANDIKLQEGHPVDENIRPLKVGGEATAIETAQSGKGARVNGDLEVTGSIPVVDTQRIQTTSTSGNGDIAVYSESGGIELATPTDNITLKPHASTGVVNINTGSTATIELFNGGDGDPHIKLMHLLNTSDYAQIKVDTNGATTLSTVDADTTVAHLTIAPDGDLILNPTSGKYIAQNNGTEFSAADSSYAGMILGYTRLQGDLSTQDTFEIQNSMTVEDDTHQITFKTPPSEIVEIEASCTINRVSTDVKICMGLSDQSATEGYNSLGVEHEYDAIGVGFSDDESDDAVIVVKWIVVAADLASIGSSNTFYIGFSTGGSTKTAYVNYGVRATHGICDHPFVIKATALPATIYDGQ